MEQQQQSSIMMAIKVLLNVENQCDLVQVVRKLHRENNSWESSTTHLTEQLQAALETVKMKDVSHLQAMALKEEEIKALKIEIRDMQQPKLQLETPKTRKRPELQDITNNKNKKRQKTVKMESDVVFY